MRPPIYLHVPSSMNEPRTASPRSFTSIFCRTTLHSSSSYRSALWVTYASSYVSSTNVESRYLNFFILYTVYSSKWICQKSLDASNRSCNIPIRPVSTHSMCCMQVCSTPECNPYCGKPSTTLTIQQSLSLRMGHVIHNTKSTYRVGFTSHSTRTAENRRMCM